MPKLSEVCRMRSKNAGPFWLTIDLFFNDQAAFDAYSAAPAISRDAFAALYHVDPAMVKNFLVPDLHVVKFSYPRTTPQGGELERDMHGGQQYVRLLSVEV